MKLKRLLLFLLFPCLTLSVAAQDKYTLNLNVTAETGESLKDVPVKMEHQDFGHTYNRRLDENGLCTITGVLAGRLRLIIEKDGLEIYDNENLEIASDTTIVIFLKEKTRLPYALKATSIHNPKTGNADVSLSWNQDTTYFFDDFESYEAFSIDFAPWTGIDEDQAPAARLSGSYPHMEEKQYATIFNPLTFSPPLWYEYPVLHPYSGHQYAAFIRTQSGVSNNDWLISPRITVGVDNVVRFMAKAGDAPKERFKVAISTRGTDKNDFIFLTQTNYEEVDYKEWKTIEYSLSQYEGQDVYIAIQYISKACFMLMVDDFYVGSRKLTPKMSKRSATSADNPREKFEVYRDDVLENTIEETAYTFKELEPGAHTLGVKAIYTVASTDTAKCQITLPDATTFVDVTAQVSVNAGISDSLVITYINRNNGTQFSDTIRQGLSRFPFFPKGDYLVSIPSDRYELYSEIIDIQKDTVIVIALKEALTAPTNLTADVIKNTENPDHTDVLLKWNQDMGWTDDFEDYEDFSQTFGQWTNIDRDQLPPYMVEKTTFPGTGEAGAAMIFNSKMTTPSKYDDMAMRAPQGDRCIAFFSAQRGQSDDWLISPKQMIREGYIVRFLAKAYTDLYGQETFRILASTDPDPSTFTELDQLSIGSSQWYEIEVDLSAYVNQELYLAVNYTSYDGYFMLLDVFYVGPSEEKIQNTKPSGYATYEIYLNDQKVDETSEIHYKFTGLSAGSYRGGVKAVYETGESKITECSWNIESGINDVTDENNGVRIYSQQHTIAAEWNHSGNTNISIYTADGQLVTERNTSETSFRYEAVQSGCYMISVTTDDKRIIRKVIVP